MRECWAVDLGDCKGKISREHIVSESLFQGPTVRVLAPLFGQPNEEKTLPLTALTRKILCQHHNSGLSEVDSEGSRAFNIFRNVSALYEKRQRIKWLKPWSVARHRIDGPKLERWFLKTTLGQVFDRVLAVGGDRVPAPPKDLVQIAFGLKSFEGVAGLYTGSLETRLGEEVKNTILSRPDGKIFGSAHSFYGLRFLLWFHTSVAPNSIEASRLTFDDWDRTDLFHHGSGFDFEQGPMEHLSISVKVSWPPAKRVPTPG